MIVIDGKRYKTARARKNGKEVTVIPWPDGIAAVENGMPISAHHISPAHFFRGARFRASGDNWEVITPFETNGA